jgi:hypothetical protein
LWLCWVKKMINGLCREMLVAKIEQKTCFCNSFLQMVHISSVTLVYFLTRAIYKKKLSHLIIAQLLCLAPGMKRSNPSPI